MVPLTKNRSCSPSRVVVEHRHAAAGRLEQIAIRLAAPEDGHGGEPGLAAGVDEGKRAVTRHPAAGSGVFLVCRDRHAERNGHGQERKATADPEWSRGDREHDELGHPVHAPILTRSRRAPGEEARQPGLVVTQLEAEVSSAAAALACSLFAAAILDSCRIDSRPRRVRISCSTPTIPWTGIRGARTPSGARASEDKPIFLSIGYSTCHWCHVMEHESFENDEIAAVLNRDFVAIKVDREERPDVDRVYMTFVQATTGSGGWPMSVWLTPDLQPFYGGTYFPPTSRWQRPGFVDVLLEVARAWTTERANVIGLGGQPDRPAARCGPRRRRAGTCRTPARSIAHARSSAGPSIPGAADSAARRSSRGRASCCSCSGSTRAPATRRPATSRCTRCGPWRSAACATTSAAASIAIRSMRTGACRTSRRCCTTRRSSCSRISRRRRSPAIRFYAAIADDTLAYVSREMTDARGGFYSAEDADSIPPEQAGVPVRTRSKARSTSGRPPRSATCSATTRLCSRVGSALEDRRQRARRSAGRVRRQEPPLHSEVRSRTSRARRAAPPKP